MKRVIGITGGVGSGKSRVLEILREEFGAGIILTDEVARTLMEKGNEGWRQVTEALGTGFLRPDGEIDRKLLADLIFSDDKIRKTVDGLIHPMTWREVYRMAREAPQDLVAVESALMGKEQRDIFGEMWYVYSSVEVRIARLMESRGYTRKKSLDIIRSQASEEEYKSLCSQIIDNSGSLEETRAQIKRLLEQEKKRDR